MGASPTLSPGGHTTLGTLLGTAAYMSPEQARGDVADAQSDLVLGTAPCSTRWRRAGRPFSGKTMAVLFDAVLNKNPRPASEVNPQLPPELDGVVARALEKERDRRYRSAADIIADLRRIAPDAGARAAGAVSAQRDMPVNAAAGEHAATASWRSSLAAAWRWRLLRPLPGRRTSPSGARTARRRRSRSTTSWSSRSRPPGRPDRPRSRRTANTSSTCRRTTRGGACGCGRPMRPTPFGFSPRSRTSSCLGLPSVQTVQVRGRVADQWRVARPPFPWRHTQLIIARTNTPVGWSPDGQQMAFITLDPATRNQELVVANRDGADERVVGQGSTGSRGFATNIPGASASAPAWSPDGRLIATFQRLSEDIRDIGVAAFDVSSGQATVVKITGDVPQGIGWLDQSTLLVGQALQQGTPSQLWQVTFPEGTRTRLTNDVNRYSELSLSADANSLVTSRLDDRVSVWVGNAPKASVTTSSTPRRICRPQRNTRRSDGTARACCSRTP